MTFRKPYVTPAKGPAGNRSIDATRPTNVNLYTNPIPFVSTDRPSATRLRGAPPQSLGLNLALITAVVAAPFFQGDWTKARAAPLPPPQSLPLNLNLFTNPRPLVTPDFSKPFTAPTASGIAFNPAIYSQADAPFYTQDFSVPFVPKLAKPAIAPNIALLNTVVVTAPFYQNDWTTTRMVPDWAPPQSLPLNLNLFTNPIPFAKYDWSTTKLQTPRAPDASKPPNPSLYTNQTPFAQFEWPLAKRVPSLPPRLFHVNQGMFTNPIPFNQTDWSKPAAAPRWPAPSHIRLPVSGVTITLLASESPDTLSFTMSFRELWVAATKESETWTPATKQDEIWTDE